MKFNQTKLNGVYVIDLEAKKDARGFLARWWDRDEFQKNGLVLDPVEGYTCATEKKGTVRGFHYVVPPHQETKLTRVIQGSLFEVVLDLRPDSATFKQWFGMTMKAQDYRLLLTPPGCAHAVLSLEDDCEYMSLYAPAYDPTIEKGIRFDDPTFLVKWPLPVKTVSDKDKSWPNFINT